MHTTWEAVKNKCLDRTIDLLDFKIAPIEGTAEAIRVLIEAAVSIEMLNLRKQE